MATLEIEKLMAVGKNLGLIADELHKFVLEEGNRIKQERDEEIKDRIRKREAQERSKQIELEAKQKEIEAQKRIKQIELETKQKEFESQERLKKKK